MQVDVYKESEKALWDEFVRKSKNGTFLFCRDYMEYHRDRFEDCSLMIRDEKGRLIALLPANRDGTKIESHGGLTYGGFITDMKMTLSKMMAIFDDVLRYLQEKKYSKVVYKTIPSIYHNVPAEEDRYCLFKKKAILYRRDVLSVIDCHCELKYQGRRVRSVKKAINNNLSVRETSDYKCFWGILAENLGARYGLKPVHSLEEIELLSKRFPNGIKLFASYVGDTMLAGAIVYLSQNVCHIQYNAASSDGKKNGGQDMIMDYLIKHYFGKKRFLDFGVSTEDNGLFLNTGLVDYKEGFGGRTLMHDFYEIDLKH